MTIKDYKRLIPFWEENYFVKEMDDLKIFKLFLKKNPKLSLVAIDNGKIIGTVLGSFDGRRGYIQKLVVDKAYRKKGIGKQLIDRLIKKLKAVGVTYISIAVEKDTAAFYENCGFKRTTQIPMNMNI